MSDADTIREALYTAARAVGFKDDVLAPVPGFPIGDAHLALDALVVERDALKDALERIEPRSRRPKPHLGLELAHLDSINAIAREALNLPALAATDTGPVPGSTFLPPGAPEPSPGTLIGGVPPAGERQET